MTHKLKPKVRWPDLHTPPENWSLQELRGVTINPLITGIGKHPRSIADEDWVFNCERDAKENGLAQFLTDLLHILRITIPHYFGESPPIGEYPQRKTAERDVPLPDVSYPGDRDWLENDWNEEMIGGMICNPVYAGIPPFPKMIDDPTWIRAGLRMVELKGLQQYLVNLLYELKKSIQNAVPRT